MNARSSNAGIVTDKRQSPKSPEDDWWNRFFIDFRPVFGNISKEKTNLQVRYLVRRLGLRKGRRFLDCPCGIGRIAIPLARLGVKVTGVDIMQSYLDETATKARRSRLNVSFRQCDMRRIPYRNEFDAAANLWTSFGYFESESDNAEVLARVYSALKPGGKFLLHLINRDWIVANFMATDWSEVEGVRILGKREFSYATSQLDDTWIFTRDGKDTVHRFPLRVYSYHELIAMFARVGFTNVEGFGSEEDEPITQDSRMMYIFGTKPKRTTRRRKSLEASS